MASSPGERRATRDTAGRPVWLNRRGLDPHKRKELDNPVLDRFTFLKDYSAVPGDNPLVSGNLSDEIQETYAECEEEPPDKREFLDLDLLDLVDAKVLFTRNDSAHAATTVQVDGQLSAHEFVSHFSKVCGEVARQQLGYLFMRIDCDSD
eukprot:4328181-Prymnesium_polylepis.1